MFKRLIKNALKRFVSSDPFDYPSSVQKAYLEKIKEPKSLEERSFCQYKAQMKLKGFWIKLLFDVASFPLFVLYGLKLGKKPLQDGNHKAVFIMDGNVSFGVLPDELKSEFGEIAQHKEDCRRLSARDRAFLFKLYLKHPFSFYYLAKVAYKISRYRYVIEKYSPKALVVHNEYSFTSSLLTDYCNRNGVELINVMHGEKLYFIRDSFFSFNRCYVWDDFYRELFISLRADPDQFIVAVPPSLKFTLTDIPKTVDYTYYLQDQNGEDLKAVVSLMRDIANSGASVAIRPHPRYTNFEDLKSFIGESPIEIEDCKTITIEESVLRTGNAISVYSTVLLQAYLNGTAAVMDDVTAAEKVRALEDLKYIILNTDCKLLSNCLQNQ